MIEVPRSHIIHNIEHYQNIIQKEMPAQLAYKIAKLIFIIAQEQITYENMKEQISLKYAKKNSENIPMRDTNNNIIIDSQYKEQVEKDIQEMLNTTIQLQIIPINIQDFKDIKFKPTEIMALMPFIKE